MPGGEPAAADRHDRRARGRARPRAARGPASPGRRRCRGRRTGARTRARPRSARSCAAARHSSSEAPPTCTIAPWPRAASAFAIGASAGTNTSQRTPRAAAAAASPCAWLPADAATTPFAQPASPSAASFAAAPRTLNEPVRWRFSAFSTTVPPARSEIVRVDSTGVRLATRSTSGRAAAIVAAETRLSVRDGKDRVDLDVGARAAATRRRSCCARAARRRSSRRRPR